MTTTVAGADDAGIEASPSPALRVAVLAASLAALTTLTAAHVVAVPIALATALLVVGSHALSRGLTSPGEVLLRKRVAVTTLAIASVTAFAVGHGQLAAPTGGVLGLLMCAAAATHGLVLDTVRDLRVNVAVSVSALILAAGLAPGLGIAAPVAITWIAAVAALVLAASDAEGTHATARATTRATGHATAAVRTAGPVTAVVAVTVLTGLALALALPHPPGLRARSSFGQSDPGSGPASGSAKREADAYLGQGALDLDARGALSKAPIAVVDRTGRTLWRATVLDTYDGRRWTTAPGGVAVVPTGAVGTGATDPATGTGLVNATVPRDTRSPAQPGSGVRKDAVGWLADTAPVVLSPGLVTDVGLRSGAVVLAEPSGRLEITATGVPVSYVARSQQVRTADSVLPAEVGVDAAQPVWRALPADLPPRVGVLARQVTAGTTDRIGAVRAIERYLQANATYDLGSPVAPPGADTVDDFLFRTRSGFCEHFASAEVVMLRTLGIPARLASGFASDGGSGAGTTTLLASDAHAWAEVWIPGSGWVSSDPTAGATLRGTDGRSLSALVASIGSVLTGSTPRRTTLVVLLLLAALGAALLPGRRRAARTAAASGRSPQAPLFAAFDRFESALARTGRARGTAESVRALATRLHHDPRASATSSPDVVDALLVVERASYAGTPPGRDETDRAASAIDRATAALLTSGAGQPRAPASSPGSSTGSS